MNTYTQLIILTSLVSLVTGCSDDDTSLFFEENLDARTIQQVFVDDSRETPRSGDIPAQTTRTLESLVFSQQVAARFHYLSFPMV